ncbi:homoserine O-acetyltransferase [Streptomyces jumonjinensis]|nr:homoserine O-acetyltransferase [Streptomyces jumonjinensis]
MTRAAGPSALLPPATGGWQEGDPVGGRRWARLEQPLPLEAGGELPGVRMAYETWGRPAADGSNAVLVLHALTGDSHVAGPAGPGHPTPGWWDGLIGPGRALDTDRWFVVAPNVLGGCQGSTGPSSFRNAGGDGDGGDGGGHGGRGDGGDGGGHGEAAVQGRRWGGSFPFLTTRDQVAAEARLADLLGIQRWALVIGGSMGGMRALEWAVSHPDRTEALLLLACTAAAGAEQIAWAGIQLHAIRSDRNWHGGNYHDAGPGGGPYQGLGVARRLAHVTYRGEAELDSRFGRAPQGTENPWEGGRYQVESYLDHHAAKLVHRFDAGSYVVLTEAMNSHDIGRGRGGTTAALRRISARTLVAGVESDRLYPLSQQHRLAASIPGADRLRVIESPYGHDGFLIETAQVASLVRELAGDPAGR